MTIKEAVKVLKCTKEYYTNEDNVGNGIMFDKEEAEAIDIAIKELEQKKKKAQWKYDNKTVVCSNCQTWFNISDRFVFMRYCPYCGRKMKSGVIE